MKKIAVIGAGYVGLVTAACFAQKNNQVIVVETNEAKIQSLLDGQVPFYEPGLDNCVATGIAQGTLIFVTTLAEALTYQPSVIFSCVGTPSLPDGSADLSYVTVAMEQIGNALNDYCLVINKSTVPVGTTRKVQAIIAQTLSARGKSISFDVASNPEFLREGNALHDFMHPDRVVVGVESEKARDILYELYDPFVASKAQIFPMNFESAELTKYASNSMLATRISFMNQLALFADTVGADIDHVRRGMGSDKRIGHDFLNAGIGYGGSCFPKDVKALINMGKEHHQPMTVAEQVELVNDQQRDYFVGLIKKHYGPLLQGKKIGIWGLAFKPETDDIRCAPSLDVIKQLLAAGATIVAYDPVAMPVVKAVLGETIKYAQSAAQVLEEADFLVLLTEWKEFRLYTPAQLTVIKEKVLFDGRNCFDPLVMGEHGITYYCIGRNVYQHGLTSINLRAAECCHSENYAY